ncbi:helix-turn-helix domain-containing protein [Nonomuraea rhizosphaerae]|uniref:helix-turn-helix domain-containing protein n=1 Tax=Nonomuraea rhizosphaerae TaxID=2665663 RepID=UPI001FE6E20A|nr:helix-turn-helix domain-containing protein [Nonomuraea rhizosphaerae]
MLRSTTQLYRVTDVMRLLRMSRTMIHEQIRSRRLRSVKQGRARLITAKGIRNYIALLRRKRRKPPHDKRRSKGDGGLHWDDKCKLRIATLTVGYTPAGKGVVKTESGRTKTTTKNKPKEIIKHYEDGLPIAPGDCTGLHRTRSDSLRDALRA